MYQVSGAAELCSYVYTISDDKGPASFQVEVSGVSERCPNMLKSNISRTDTIITQVNAHSKIQAKNKHQIGFGNIKEGKTWNKL
jgi:hypothetical protein